MTKQKEAVTPEASAEQLVQQQNVMLASYDELMGGQRSTLELKGGREIELYAAKVKHLRQVTEFITDFVTSFEQNKLVSLIMKVSDRQEQRLKDGVDPFSLNTQEIVRDLAGEMGILASIINGGFGRIGDLVAIFSSLPAEDFEELEGDEALALILGIFGRNYAFFTQQVRPLALDFIARLLTQNRSQTASLPQNGPGKGKSSKGK